MNKILVSNYKEVKCSQAFDTTNEADQAPNISTSERSGLYGLGICLKSYNSVSFNPPILISKPPKYK